MRDIIKYLIIIAAFIPLFSVIAQEHVLDNGVQWLSDSWIALEEQGTVVDSPYVYSLKGYGIELSEIVFVGDSLNFVVLDTLKGFTQCEESFTYLNNVIIWGKDVLYIAERVENELFMRSRIHVSENIQIHSVSSDSIIVHSKGFVDIHDLENPIFTWDSSSELYISDKSYLIGNRFFNIEYLESEMTIWDVSDLSSPVYLGSELTTNLRGTWGKPIFLNNKIFFLSPYMFTVLTLDENFDLISLEDFSYSEMIEQDSFIARGSGMFNDSLIYVFNFAEHQSLQHSILLLDPESEENQYYHDFVYLDLPIHPGSNVQGSDFYSNFGSYIMICNDYLGMKYVINLSDLDAPVLSNSIILNKQETPYIYKQFNNRIGYIFDRSSSSNGWSIAEISDDEPEILFNLPENETGYGIDTDVYDTLYAFDVTSAPNIPPTNGQLYSFIREEERLSYLYDLPLATGYELIPFESDIILLSAAFDDSLQIYQIGPDSTTYLSSLDFPHAAYIIQFFTGEELILNTSDDKVYSILVEENGSCQIVDSLSQIPPLYNCQLLYDSESIMASLYDLFQINADHTLAHLYRYQPINGSNGFPPTISGLNDDKVAVSWNTPDHFLTTTIFDISENFNDTLAHIRRMPERRRKLICGDTVWVANTYTLSKYLITHDFNNVINIDVGAVGIPSGLNIESIFPNPFNNVARINFTLPEKSHINLSVYNILGQQVALLNDEILDSGKHSFIFDGSNLSSGIYFVSLDTEYEHTTRKIVLLK